MARAGKIEGREQLSCEMVLFSGEEFRVRTLIRDGIDASPFSKKKILLHFKAPALYTMNNFITITRRIMRIARFLAANFSL